MDIIEDITAHARRVNGSGMQRAESSEGPTGIITSPTPDSTYTPLGVSISTTLLKEDDAEGPDTRWPWPLLWE